MKVAWFDAFSGVSGDMTLAALIDAGWSERSLRDLPRRLRLEHVQVEVGRVQKGAFAATRVDVRAEGRQPHRHLHHITAMLDAADLPETVRARARAVFRRLAEAEATVHGSTVERVHFHEVGAADALVDIAGALWGLHELGVERVHASPLPMGSGFVDSQHGRIPVPAPATLLLLKGCPVRASAIEAELVTPTGAALLAEVVSEWSPPAEFRVTAVGVGAGARDLAEQPNVLRLVIGETAGRAGLTEGSVAVLETALDDESPQVLGDLVGQLLDQGALDVMLAPVLMKKGRPGQWLVVLCAPERAESMATFLLARTSTLGVRRRIESRWELPRSFEVVQTRFGDVRMKVAVLPDGARKAAPEFEDVRDAARRSGASARVVAEDAKLLWLQRERAKPTSPSEKTD